jgi:hypothetical protein
LDAGLSLLNLRHGFSISSMISALLTERNNGPTKLFRVRRLESRLGYFAPRRELAQDTAAFSNEFVLFCPVSGLPSRLWYAFTAIWRQRDMHRVFARGARLFVHLVRGKSQ